MSQTARISRNNTAQINHEDGSRSVILHSTEVIRHWPQERKVRLNTGGWSTATTRTRMNQALNEWNLPARVSMLGGSPTVCVNGKVLAFSGAGVCEFNY